MTREYITEINFHVLICSPFIKADFLLRWCFNACFFLFCSPLVVGLIMPLIIYCLFKICFLFLNIEGLLAAGVKKTKCTQTMRWLKSRQNPDGSFINLLSTIYVIPALIGALPYDLKDIRCPKNTTGKLQYTAYSLFLP